MSKSVSVIIPVYNRQKEVGRCIESVLNQSDVDVQIIVIDDGSTDDSLNICKSYSDRFPNVEVYHIENRGTSGARNVGLSKVTGDYIMFLDSDDEIAECSIGILLKAALDSDADIVLAKYTQVTSDGKHHDIEIPSRYCNRIINEKEFWEIVALDGIYIGVSPCTKLFKASVWEELRFPDELRIHEDECVLHRYISICPKIYMFDHTFYIQHIHGAGEGIMGGRFQYKHLIGADVRLERISYLMSKKYYEAALFTFGFGSRIILIGQDNFKDEVSKKEIARLYKEYKKKAVSLIKVVDFKNKIRLCLFMTNLKLYGKVRKLLR